MKYIRTEDGVYEFERYYELLDYYWLKGLSEPIGKEEIIEQADTIEELCDEFVMFTNGNKRNIRVYKTMHSISLYTKRDKKYKGNMVEKVYSAIWTDKGLIYVAKMNDKGELELL